MVAEPSDRTEFRLRLHLTEVKGGLQVGGSNRQGCPSLVAPTHSKNAFKTYTYTIWGITPEQAKQDARGTIISFTSGYVLMG